MSHSVNKNGDNNDECEDVIYCNIDADSDYSSLEVVEAIAELEGKRVPNYQPYTLQSAI